MSLETKSTFVGEDSDEVRLISICVPKANLLTQTLHIPPTEYCVTTAEYTISSNMMILLVEMVLEVVRQYFLPHRKDDDGHIISPRVLDLVHQDGFQLPNCCDGGRSHLDLLEHLFTVCQPSYAHHNLLRSRFHDRLASENFKATKAPNNRSCGLTVGQVFPD